MSKLVHSEELCSQLALDASSAKERQTASHLALIESEAAEKTSRTVAAEARRSLERSTTQLEVSRGNLMRAKCVEASTGERVVHESLSAANECVRAAAENEHLSIAREREARLCHTEALAARESVTAGRNAEHATYAYRNISATRAIHDSSPKRTRVAYVPDVTLPLRSSPSPSPARVGYDSPTKPLLSAYSPTHRTSSVTPRTLSASPRFVY
eukprot:Sspe_Gene.5521::Locus_1824_Transcript_2_2_Confidence_0.667_Length_1731::g.5521::m.5521